MPTAPALERKQLSLSDLQFSTADAGSFRGRASAFNGVDSYGDTIVPGAYKDTLPKFLADGFIAWGHDDLTPVAYPTAAREEADGLWVEATFHSTPTAQEARRITQERAAAGKRTGLSIGYFPVKAESGPDGTRRLLAIDLVEVSIVLVPADDAARVAEVKQADHDTKAAVGVHHTDTSTGAWDGPANTARAKTDQPASYFRQVFAWQDPQGDAAKKDAWRFIHHEVSGDGAPGAANMKACATLIGVLNGGRGVDVSAQPWAKDRAGIHAHVAAHMKDGNMEPPPLKSLADLAVKYMGMPMDMPAPPPGSFEALAAAIESAYEDAYLAGGGDACVVATFPDRAIVCVMAGMGMLGDMGMDYYSVPYTRQPDGSVTLGTPQSVQAQTTYIAAAKRRAAEKGLGPDHGACGHGTAWREHTQTVLDALTTATQEAQGFYIRALAQDALERKEGRTLSAATRAQLQQVLDAEESLGAAFSVIKQLLADTAPPPKGWDYRLQLRELESRLRLQHVVKGALP